jgi:putative intracellular protease/amidase
MGYEVDFASIAGGAPRPDGIDYSDPVQRRFLAAVEVQEALTRTPSVAKIDPADYRAVFLAGGYAAMWDMPGHAPLGELVAGIWTAGGIVNAVCHGPAGLLPARRRDGTPLVSGLEVTGFSRDEERKAGMLGILPLLLPDALTALGARYKAGPSFKARVVLDSRIVTGQNPASAPEAARATMRLVAAMPPSRSDLHPR